MRAVNQGCCPGGQLLLAPITGIKETVVLRGRSIPTRFPIKTFFISQWIFFTKCVMPAVGSKEALRLSL